MAVKDEDVYHPTESLILSKPRRHFNIQVSVIHWQLCSLISADKRDTVYYPTGNESRDIQRLNAATGEIETIRRLQFQPKSLIAQNGWVCCGGEKGEFSAVQVDGANGYDEAEADARLPLDIVSSRAEDGIISSLARARASSKSFVVKSKSFGSERVNCVTLWFPPTLSARFEGAYDQPVAALANNNKVVYLVTLRDQQAVDEVTYPDCVNRAVISPDGRLLAAICDDPYLYVHERVERVEEGLFSPRFRFSTPKPAYEWKLCSRIFLRSQNRDDRTDNRGSFAICFSSTGKYLAVGTQYGTVSIFDPSKFTTTLDSDALIMHFNTTRPKADVGAVRDMAFAPGASDLLAWTEDRGRVGVADIRRGFLSRQILYLDRPNDYDHVSVSDVTSVDPRNLSDVSSIDPRLLTLYRDGRNGRSDNVSSSFANTPDLSLESRRAVETARELADRYHPPLTSEETSVLEALQENRRRRDQRTAAAAAASAVAQSQTTPSPPTRGYDRSARPASRLPQGTEIARTRDTSSTRAMADILNNIRSQRDRLLADRETQERLRPNARSDTPERTPGPGVDHDERTRASTLRATIDDLATDDDRRRRMLDDAEERLQTVMSSEARQRHQRMRYPPNERLRGSLRQTDRLRAIAGVARDVARENLDSRERSEQLQSRMQDAEERLTAALEGQYGSQDRPPRESTVRASIPPDGEDSRSGPLTDSDLTLEAQRQLMEIERQLEVSARGTTADRWRDVESVRSYERHRAADWADFRRDPSAWRFPPPGSDPSRRRGPGTGPGAETGTGTGTGTGSGTMPSAPGRRTVRLAGDVGEGLVGRFMPNPSNPVAMSPPATTTVTSRPASGAWGDATAAYQGSVGDAVSTDDFRAALEADARRTWTEANAESRRERVGSMRDWADGTGRRTALARSQYLTRDQPRPDPHDTSGLSWSADGQVLYVGAENGIYQFRVNALGRKFFPSLDWR